MRNLALMLAVIVTPATADAARSYWNPSRTAIYTLEDDGQVRLGGTVDGVTMIQFHATVGGESPFIGFVRSRTDSGGPLRWGQSCVYVTPDAAGSNDVAGDGETEVLEKVLATWTEATRDCSEFTFILDEPQAREVGYDGYNLVKYRESTWCRPAPEEGCPPECYSASAAAITTLFFINRPGESDDGLILDADIEVNSVDFAVATGCETTCVSEGEGILADLENTMTHEVGHLIGLDHTCWEGAAADAPLDHEGNPAPSCFPESSLTAEQRDATMYNFQTPGEIKKRSVEPDDIAGFCAIYPLEADLSACGRVDVDGDSGWCTVAPADEPRGRRIPAALAVLGLIGLSVLARRQRRRDPS